MELIIKQFEKVECESLTSADILNLRYSKQKAADQQIREIEFVENPKR